MDLKLVLGKSINCFCIGEPLRDVVSTLQCLMPGVRANFLYENKYPVLNDMFIDFSGPYGNKYLIEFDPFLQLVRAVNYTVSYELKKSKEAKKDTLWKISGSHVISHWRPLTISDIVSEFGDPCCVFTASRGWVLKLLYDGVCLIFRLEKGLQESVTFTEIKKLASSLTNVRVIPKKESPYFRCLDRNLAFSHSVDLSLYGLVQVGLIVDDHFGQVVGITVIFPSDFDCKTSSSDQENSTYSRRIYFGQSCQCVLSTLGAPDSVHYQQKSATQLISPVRHRSRSAAQRFIFSYKRFGLDIVFDIEMKLVKRFIFHSNLPDHVDVNMHGRCFYRFGINEGGFAKKGKAFTIHPGVNWSEITKYVKKTHVKLLVKMYRNHSTNALYPFPLSPLWILFNQLVFEVTGSDGIATISVCCAYSDQQLAILGKNNTDVLLDTSLEEEFPTPLSSIGDTSAVVTSDVKVASLEVSNTQSRPAISSHSLSSELLSIEPHEESYKSVHSSLSDDEYQSLHGSHQDDDRGMIITDSFKLPRLPYTQLFQAYYHIGSGNITHFHGNTVINCAQLHSRETDGGKYLHFIHVETFEHVTACEEASGRILKQSDNWRVSWLSKEELDAIEAAAREEEVLALHQQSSSEEENFVCDSTTAAATEPDVYSSSISSDKQISISESNSVEYQEVIDTKDCPIMEDTVSVEPAVLLFENNRCETEQGAFNTNANTVLLEDITTIEPSLPLTETSMLEDGCDSEGEHKETEAELVYKPQTARLAASRTQGIIKTVTSLPKKHGEYQPRKKSNPKVSNTNTPQNHMSKSAASKSPLAVNRKVHFYTEEKSKAITAKLKSRQPVEIVKRAHKDGSAYPRHHFKSDQLSALLGQGDDDVSRDNDITSKVPTVNRPNTFTRIFAPGEGSNANVKTQQTVNKLNTPFATEHNSTVYSEVTDGDDLLPSSNDPTDQITDQDSDRIGQPSTTNDDQSTSEVDQSAEDKAASQSDISSQTVCEDDQNANEAIQLSTQVNKFATTTDQDDSMKYQGSEVLHDDQITDQFQSSEIINGQEKTNEQQENAHLVTETHIDVTAAKDGNSEQKLISLDEPVVETHGAVLSQQDDSSGEDMTPLQEDGNMDQETRSSFSRSLTNDKQQSDMSQENDTASDREENVTFESSHAFNGCPNQLESISGTLENNDVSDRYQTERLSSDNEGCNSRLLGGNTNNPAVASVSDEMNSNGDNDDCTPEEDVSDEDETTCNLTPRKQWSTTQVIQSAPDSLNQEHVMLEHLLDGHEDVCSTLLDRMEFLDHVSKCLENSEPLSSLNLDCCESTLLADVTSLLHTSDRTLSLEDMVGLLSPLKQLLVADRTDRQVNTAAILTMKLIESHHQSLKRYNEGQMRKDSTEYFHCQQCYDGLEDIAKHLERLLQSETIDSDTMSNLDKLSTTLNKLFRKLETA